MTYRAQGQTCCTCITEEAAADSVRRFDVLLSPALASSTKTTTELSPQLSYRSQKHNGPYVVDG
eukprot:6172642-Pleurochrysis_carterae.AAC.1